MKQTKICLAQGSIQYGVFKVRATVLQLQKDNDGRMEPILNSNTSLFHPNAINICNTDSKRLAKIKPNSIILFFNEKISVTASAGGWGISFSPHQHTIAQLDWERVSPCKWQVKADNLFSIQKVVLTPQKLLIEADISPQLIQYIEITAIYIAIYSGYVDSYSKWRPSKISLYNLDWVWL